MQGHDIIVIGASIGGVQALTSLVPQFPAHLEAAIFVVMHLSSDTESMLDVILDRLSPLQVAKARDGERIHHGRIYIAPPDYHLLVKRDYVRVVQGPRENRWRPAIDPLFRSAAVAYGPRVVGVVLTGYLDDGTAGMLAIKRCGGLTMVQSPDEAIAADMPQSVLNHMDVDYCVPIVVMGEILQQLTRQPVQEALPVPPDIESEARMAERLVNTVAGTEKLGTLSALVCPDCKGPLWKIEDRHLRRYRCYIGHAYTARALLSEQHEVLEGTLWAALRMFEERTNLLTKMATDEKNAGRPLLVKNFEERAAEAKRHAEVIRQLLIGDTSYSGAPESSRAPTS